MRPCLRARRKSLASKSRAVINYILFAAAALLALAGVGSFVKRWRLIRPVRYVLLIFLLRRFVTALRQNRLLAAGLDRLEYLEYRLL